MEERAIRPAEAVVIVERDESHFWDVKSVQSGGAVVQKIAVALANAEGGEFVVGIEDRKKFVGLDRWKGFFVQEDANWIHTTLVKEISPPVPYDLEFLRVSSRPELGLACLVTTIQKSPDVHKTARQEVFRRRGAQTLELRGTAIADLTLSKGAKSYEDQLLDDYDLDELADEGELQFFLNEYTPASEPDRFLRKQRLVDRKSGRATVAAAILFADEPSAIAPKRCAVKIARYETCLLYTSPSPRDRQKSRMPSSA